LKIFRAVKQRAFVSRHYGLETFGDEFQIPNFEIPEHQASRRIRGDFIPEKKNCCRKISALISGVFPPKILKLRLGVFQPKACFLKFREEFPTDSPDFHIKHSDTLQQIPEIFSPTKWGEFI